MFAKFLEIYVIPNLINLLQSIGNKCFKLKQKIVQKFKKFWRFENDIPILCKDTKKLRQK